MQDNTWIKKGKRTKEATLKALGLLYGDGKITPGEGIPIVRKSRKRKKKRQYIEDGHCIYLYQWACCVGLGEDLQHIPNEGKRTNGDKLRKMGMIKGSSDYFLARPSHGFAGFWIEMKAPGKKPTPEQLAFLANKAKRGYHTGWFDHWEKAKEAIQQYLGL